MKEKESIHKGEVELKLTEGQRAQLEKEFGVKIENLKINVLNERVKLNPIDLVAWIAT